VEKKFCLATVNKQPEFLLQKLTVTVKGTTVATLLTNRSYNIKKYK